MLFGRLVYVGKTLTDLQIWAVNSTKRRLAAAGSAQTHWEL